MRVSGVGLRGLREPEGPVDCGNAGTLVRLVAGILAGQGGKRFELTGDESLSKRPMGRIADPLTLMGAMVETTGGGLPLRIEGRALAPLRYELPVASAQVKSCVLLAGLFAEGGPTTVVEPVPTRDHTERMLRAAGASVRASAGSGRGAAGRAARPAPAHDPGRFLLDGPVPRRRDAASRLPSPHHGRRRQPDTYRPDERPRADGRADLALQPHLLRRGAGSRHRGRARRASSRPRSAPARCPG